MTTAFHFTRGYGIIKLIVDDPADGVSGLYADCLWVESDLVLDIYGKNALSMKVGEYQFHGAENQLWTFEPVL